LIGMAEEAKWYVVQTYSGYENAVKTAVEKAAVNRKMTDLILEAVIPTEKVIEKTEKGEKEIEHKIIPGYVFLKMILTDETWHLVNNIRGATGFVGADRKAIPLTIEEAQKLGLTVEVEEEEEEFFDPRLVRRVVNVEYKDGDEVTIKDGPFAGNTGKVDSIDLEEEIVYVEVAMFGGRGMTLELELDQVEKIKE